MRRVFKTDLVCELKQGEEGSNETEGESVREVTEQNMVRGTRSASTLHSRMDRTQQQFDQSNQAATRYRLLYTTSVAH